MEDLTPNNILIIPIKDKILVVDFENDPSIGLGAQVGGLGGRSAKTVSEAINAEGNLVTDLINTRLDTEVKTILGEFTFAGSGALAIATDDDNGLWISPTGILAKKSGVNTLTVTNEGDVTMIGTITATTGAIGGWNISATALYYDGATNALSAGMASADYPFYAGKKYADRATAPFRVTPAGALTATSATITGGIIDETSTIGGTLVSTILTDISGNTTSISTNASGIATNVTDIGGNTSNITQNATSISTEVTDRTNADSTLQSSITQNANNINLRVEKNDVVNQINISTEGILIAGDNIQLNGDTTVEGNFSVSGNVVSGGTITGTTIQTAAVDNWRAELKQSGEGSYPNELIFYAANNNVLGEIKGTVGGNLLVYGQDDVHIGTLSVTSLIVDATGISVTGNIAVTGTVDGVDIAAHKARHYAGGADAVIRTSQSSGSNLGISAGWAYTHDNTASAHHSSTSNALAITPSSVVASGNVSGANLITTSGYLYYRGHLMLDMYSTHQRAKVPFGFKVLSSAPGAASSFQGCMYYNTTQEDLVFSNGVNWYKVSAEQI